MIGWMEVGMDDWMDGWTYGCIDRQVERGKDDQIYG